MSDDPQVRCYMTEANEPLFTWSSRYFIASGQASRGHEVKRALSPHHLSTAGRVLDSGVDALYQGVPIWSRVDWTRLCHFIPWYNDRLESNEYTAIWQPQGQYCCWRMDTPYMHAAASMDPRVVSDVNASTKSTCLIHISNAIWSHKHASANNEGV